MLIWPDAFGLRPSMREMGKRLAAQGYSVLVPNPFYRVGKAPMFEDASTVDFAANRAKLGPLMASVTTAGNAEKDAVAYIAFLDSQKEVNKSKKIGTQGYCMGGALVVRTAATVPDRVGAGASFHGGGLVTDNPDSPHLLAPKIKAHMYFGVAASDDSRQPRRQGQTQRSLRRGPRSRGGRSVPPGAFMAGACPTCRSRTRRRSTTNPTPSAPGASYTALRSIVGPRLTHWVGAASSARAPEAISVMPLQFPLNGTRIHRSDRTWP